MVTMAERGRQARQRLLRAATELIAERGWSAISTRLLAERAGVAPGVVHYHFPSVQALLSEAALGAARSLTAQAVPVLAGTRSAGEALSVLLDALDGAGAVSVLFVETYLAAARDEALRTALGEVIGEFRRELADRFAAHAVPDPGGTAAVVAAAVDGVVLHRALLPGLDGATVATVLRRLLADGSEATP
ncbi:TetR/AcrR family transcriptional regulator [Couchioplanes azureus]|uniref:TetR/AcrR family transcriptional regulator n=1 Tax=Couchioplanes caeruleus TaxID=56438 RepID=UPI001670F769|nr:TetR/AcrR family transcriptional regulator [Couchioplanes caeruleus]GGQ73942.1 TetR family transcriptional regulator [Couchioplanes caeruleus subsp. azureus]